MEGDVLARVAKNSIVIAIEKFVEVSIGIASVAILARYFNVETFGLYAFITTFVGLLFGVGYGNMERIIIRDMVRDKDRYLEYFQGVKGTSIIISMVTVILIVILSYFLKLSSADSSIAVLLFTLSEVVSLYGTIHMTIFKVFENMEYNTLITVFSKTLTLLGIITVIYIGLGFLAIFIAMLLGNTFKTLLTISIFKKKISSKPIPVSFSNVKLILKESYPMILSTFFSMASIRMGVFVLMSFGTLRGVALFQASNNVILQFYLIPVIIISALFPVMASSITNKNEEQGLFLDTVFDTLTKFIFIMSLPLVVIAYSYAQELITIIYGGQYIDATPAIRILMLSLVFIFLANLFEVGLILKHKQHLFSIGCGVGFFVNLIFSLFLVSGYGFIGSAIAMFLSNMALSISLYLFILNYTDIKINSATFIKPSIAGITMTSYLYFFLPGNNALSAIGILNVLIALTLYALVIFIGRVFSEKEIMFIKDVLTRFRHGNKRLSNIDEAGIIKDS